MDLYHTFLSQSKLFTWDGKTETRPNCIITDSLCYYNNIKPLISHLDPLLHAKCLYFSVDIIMSSQLASRYKNARITYHSVPPASLIGPDRDHFHPVNLLRGRLLLVTGAPFNLISAHAWCASLTEAVRTRGVRSVTGFVCVNQLNDALRPGWGRMRCRVCARLRAVRRGAAANGPCGAKGSSKWKAVDSDTAIPGGEIIWLD